MHLCACVKSNALFFEPLLGCSGGDDHFNWKINHALTIGKYISIDPMVHQRGLPDAGDDRSNWGLYGFLKS